MGLATVDVAALERMWLCECSMCACVNVDRTVESGVESQSGFGGAG